MIRPFVAHLFRTRTGLLALLLVLLVAGLAGSAAATPPAAPAVDTRLLLPLVVGPPSFTATPSAVAFDRITDIASAGDGRLFIAERGGIVRVVQPSGAVSTFLDISDRVIDSSGEQGMFGLAFHPDYANNGSFFLTYTGKVGSFPDTNLIMSRFQVSADPNVALPDSEEFLVKIGQAFEIHNGGGLRFNPVDGYLYLGVGDDSQNLVAQDNKSSKGKILQVDVDSASAVNAPSLQAQLDAQAAVPVNVYAMGLRNPWKFGFDPVSGDLYIGDVGDRTWEEINIVPFGSADTKNFGWPCMEGPDVRDDGGPCSRPDRFDLPAYYYSDGCAIIGGEVYRPAADPTADGRFIFGDSCTLEIFSFSRVNNTWQAEKLGDIPAPTGVLTTFGLDNEGTLYAGTLGTSAPYYRLFIPPAP